MTIGFAPTNPNPRPRWGTPPIAPEPGESQRSRDKLADGIRDRAPLIAAILTMPVACDDPRTGGIAGPKSNPKPPLVCYMA